MVRKILIVHVVLMLGYHAYPQVIGTTDRYEFHSNPWVNMHHFLYEKASGAQQRKLKEDGFNFVTDEDQQTIDALSDDDRVHFDSAISYYSRKVIDKKLKG